MGRRLSRRRGVKTMAAVHPAERATARPAPREAARAPSPGPTTPSPADHVLALQRRAGNQAVAASIVQRDRNTPPAEPTPNASIEIRVRRSRDPDEWIREFVRGAKRQGWDTGVSVILTVASNTAYAFNTDGGGRREVAMHLGDDLREPFVSRVDVANASWAKAGSTQVPPRDGSWTPPLPDAAVQRICEAMGFAYHGPRSLWVLLDVEPDLSFALPRDVQPAENSPALQRKARQIADEIAAMWRVRAAHERSPTAATPMISAEYNERTGWHILVTLGSREARLPLALSDTTSAMAGRVDRAITTMRSDAKLPAPHQAPAPGGPSGAKAAPPPVWYVPFAEHAAVKGGRPAANAPPLPASVLYQADETETHPTVIVGATYDFRMRVEWEFAGPFGAAEAMNAGYYWELLAASPADWARLAGEPTTPAATARRPPTPTPADRPENRRVGRGTRVTRWDDASAGQRQERRKVGEDMAHDVEDDDTTGVAGEAVAGGFRIVKTQVIATLGDILDHRDPSNRRVEFPAPGYYLIRCLSAAATSGKDPDKDFIRSPSVAVIPVKAQLSYGVAKSRAKEDLARAAGQGAFARYADELKSTRATLEAARALQARFASDPTLRPRLAADPVTAAARLTVRELAVLGLAEQHGVSIEQLVIDLANRINETAGSDHEATVTSWHTELKKETDYPVGASFITQDAGQEIPLRLMVGQAADSTDAAPHWMVFDITTERSRERYEGRGAPGAHAGAIREALGAFAGENPYGYGEIGLAWPSSFDGVDVKGADLPVRLHSAPDADQRRKHRRRAYVDIATLLLPVAKVAKLRGVVTAVEAFIALLGAKNAVDALRDRSRTGHLYEPATLLEVVQVVGAVRTIGEGVRFVAKGMKAVEAARRVGDTVELLTRLEGGLQVVSIPFTVREQLAAIDALRATATGEHKAAMLAFVLGRAVRQGVVGVRAIRPGEETLFYDDSKETHSDQPHEHQVPERHEEHDEAAGGAGGRAGGGQQIRGPVAGMSHDTEKTLRAFCKNYGVVIDVRPTTASASEWRGVGAVPKPEAIKAKTINEYDRLLGAPHGAIGLVGYFDPKLPKRPAGMSDAEFGRLQGRYHERAAEFQKLAKDMAELQRDGRVRIRDGVIELLDPRKGGEHYAPVTGDHDVFDIQWADNRPMSDAQADGFAAMLRSMNIGIEHPAHMRWRPTAAKDVAMYKDIIAQHTPGPAFKGNLVRFAPGEPPHEVAAGTPVSPTTPTGRPTWDVHVTEPGRTGGGGGHHGSGGPSRPGAPIPPLVHETLQRFADAYHLDVNVRRDARGNLRVDVEWTAPTSGPPPPAMTDVERHAFNQMLTDMNIGVVPSGHITGGAAPIVRVRPAPAPAGTRSQGGTQPRVRIDEVPSRVGQPGYEDMAPAATDIPGRAGLNEVEQRALDRYVDGMRRQRRMTPQLEGQLRAASPDELRRRLRQMIAEQPRVDADRRRAEQIHETNAPDPRQARFDHEHDEGGGVTARWNGTNRPSADELEQAREIATATGDRVVVYGDSFAGVDGTIGTAPVRLLQLKTARDAATLVRVLNEAKQNAQRQGDRGLEVHIIARDLSLAEATQALRAAPVPYDSWLGRVTIHVRGGHFDVPSSGRP